MKQEDSKLSNNELSKVSGGGSIPENWTINYISYTTAKRFIKSLYEKDGVEEAIKFGKERIVDSNLWDTMRQHGPEYAVDRVYGFYSRTEGWVNYYNQQTITNY